MSIRFSDVFVQGEISEGRHSEVLLISDARC